MDAVKFIKERNRMCRSFGGSCGGCPADKNTCCDSFEWREELATIVEKWSAEHPRKTRQDVFLEQWPEAYIHEDGCLDICPLEVSAAHRDADGCCQALGCLCSGCRREFWMQEVE